MNLYEILQNSGRVGEGMTHFERLFAQKVGGGGGAAEITGVPPLRYIGDGRPLTDYRIAGNTIQDGTPSPEAPVDVIGCGAWDEAQQSYKLPLTVNGAEYPIYLGQVETTRRIKKLAFDGTERWYTAVSSSGLFGIQRFEPMQAHPFIPGYSAISNCYVYNPVQSGIDAAMVSGEFALQAFPVVGVYQYNFFIKDGRFSNVSDFVSYLAAQYANGTPVTVWYVLAEPETAIVNEPLMKIGDYADTVSFAQAGVTIPTVNGENVLDVPTEVKPSEVWIRGRIKEV